MTNKHSTGAAARKNAEVRADRQGVEADLAARIAAARNSVLEAIRQLEEVQATVDEKSQLWLYLTEVLRDRLDPAADELAPDQDDEDDPIHALTRAVTAKEAQS